MATARTTRTTKKKKKDEGIKITNPKMQTQAGPMTKPVGAMSKTAKLLTPKEVEEYKKKKKRK